ncbi:MAG: superoxide dismutase family protein [Nannocystaceae bacterium]
MNARLGNLLVLSAVLGSAALACQWGREDAHAHLEPIDASGVEGDVRFTAVDGRVRIEGKVSGLAPGKHGFHIHEFGSCEGTGASAAGGHYNPEGSPHGAPWSSPRHAGDLGNIEADADGVAEVRIETDAISLGTGPRDVVGRSLIVHADLDHFTQPTGDADGKVACAMITASHGATRRIEPEPE